MKPAKKHNPETKKTPVETDPLAFLEIDFGELGFDLSVFDCSDFDLSVFDDLEIFNDLKT